MVDCALETFVLNLYETEHDQFGEDIAPEIVGVHIDSTTELRIAYGYGVSWPLDRPKTVEITQHLSRLFPELGFELCHSEDILHPYRCARFFLPYTFGWSGWVGG